MAAQPDGTRPWVRRTDTVPVKSLWYCSCAAFRILNRELWLRRGYAARAKTRAGGSAGEVATKLH